MPTIGVARGAPASTTSLPASEAESPRPHFRHGKYDAARGARLLEVQPSPRSELDAVR